MYMQKHEKFWKFLKGLYLAALGFVEEMLQYLLFLTSDVYSFSSEKDPGAVKIASHILKSPFIKSLSKF